MTNDSAAGTSAQRSCTHSSPASAVSPSGAGGTASTGSLSENGLTSSAVKARTANVWVSPSVGKCDWVKAGFERGWSVKIHTEGSISAPSKSTS
jgi:hypothetical protein